MKETQLQIKLPGVPKAKQGREVPPQWEWTEASVWTERMVATLERGIKGGKWYSLMIKSGRWKTCNGRSEKVAAGKSPKKPDGRKCRRYARAKRPETAALAANAQGRTIPTQTCPTGLDTQAGQQRAATTRDTPGREPSGGNGLTQRARTDIRAQLCRTQLRIQTRRREPKTRYGEWTNCSGRERSGWSTPI